MQKMTTGILVTQTADKYNGDPDIGDTDSDDMDKDVTDSGDADSSERQRWPSMVTCTDVDES